MAGSFERATARHQPDLRKILLQARPVLAGYTGPNAARRSKRFAGLSVFMADEIQNEFADELFAHSVRVVRSPKSNDQLLALAKRRANDPTIFDQHPPIFFSVEASNNGMDSYYTRMAPSSLRNFLADARAGVSFQDSHRTRELGLGGTLDAELLEEADTLRLVADIYTLPGLSDLDAFIHRFRAGIARDVSIGFYGGKHLCSICNRNIWSWDCPHIPGIEYEVEQRNEKGDVISRRKQVAFAWVDGARLSEISAVYDGATPGCAILKAQREADAGRMTPDVAYLLESRYQGVRFVSAHRRWPGADLPDTAAIVSAGITKHRGFVMADQDINSSAGQGTASEKPSGAAPAEPPAIRVVPDYQFERLVADLAEAAGVPESERADVRTVATQLRQTIKDGLAYRERLVADALTEGVRLFGNEFDQEGTRALFARADCEQIRLMGDQWRKQADKQFPAGRQSLDEAEAPATTQKAEPPLPATYFGG